eukprot:7892136-Pyramimonas_sp.AAC.1
MCKDADPTKLDRPKQQRHRAFHLRREQRLQLQEVSGHVMKTMKGRWVCQECWKTPGKYSLFDWLRTTVCIGRQYAVHRADHGHAVQ